MAVNFFDNFSIQTDKPIDIRMTVSTKSALYAPTSYSNGLYAYKGMTVTVLNDETSGNQVQTYILLTDKSGYTTEGNWRKFAVGNSYIGDLDDITITNPQPGDILIYNNVTGQWENRGPVVETITEYSGTDKAGFTVLKTDGTSEFIVINELDDNVVLATQTKAGIVEMSKLSDIQSGTITGESGALIAARAVDVRDFVIANRDLVYPPPTTPTSSGLIGTWSYDERYVYYCIPAIAAGTNGIWRRTRIDVW